MSIVVAAIDQISTGYILTGCTENLSVVAGGNRAHPQSLDKEKSRKACLAVEERPTNMSCAPNLRKLRWSSQIACLVPEEALPLESRSLPLTGQTQLSI